MECRNFRCERCAETFDGAKKLNRHNKTHLKPHQCNICSRGFALRLDLNRHVKARHQLGHERHLCAIQGCTFTATRKDNLRQHHIRAHKEIPRTQWTFVEEAEEMDLPKHERTPENSFVIASSDSSQDSVQPWAGKVFLQGATTGDLAILEASLAGGIDVNTRAGDGSSALHCAARAGHTALVELLLQKGAIIDAINLKERSPLHEALLGKSLETVKLLLRGGACLHPSRVTENCLAWSGNAEILKTCLDYLSDKAPKDLMYHILIAASRDGQDSTVKALLPLFGEFNPSLNGVERTFEFTAWQNYRYSQIPSVFQDQGLHRLTHFTPLHVAAAKGHCHIVQMLVNYGADINQDFKRITPLHVAIDRGHAEVVRYIVSLPVVDVHCKRYFDNLTPLHSAAVHGRNDIIKLLLSHPKIDINSTSRNGSTPLRWAISWGHQQVVQLLLQDLRTNAKLKDNGGLTPLQFAALANNLEAVYALLNHEDIKAAPDMTAQVLQQGSLNPLEVMKRLLAHHEFQDVNIVGYSRNSKGCLLSAAICSGHYDCVQLILSHEDVDVNIRCGIFKETPLIVACEFGNEGIVELLLQHKDIDVNKRGWYNPRSALAVARSKGHGNIVDLLLRHGAIDDDNTMVSSSDSAHNANRPSVERPQVEEQPDPDLEHQPYSFLDEYMEDLDGLKASCEGATTSMDTIMGEVMVAD